APVGLDGTHGRGGGTRELGTSAGDQQRLSGFVALDGTRGQGIGKLSDRFQREQRVVGKGVTDAELAAADGVGAGSRIEFQQALRWMARGGGVGGSDSEDSHTT